MANIVRFPRPLRGKPGTKASPGPKLSERFRENTRHKLRSIIARALEVLDSMDRELPAECAEPSRGRATID